MKAAGCIVIGKTNMPEFGLGSHTYNDVFGTTGNAWDPAVSAGGSSGGAAVALAQRLLPVADGSDFMGSLRNPAAGTTCSACAPARAACPPWPVADVWVSQLGTDGPMARTVRDLAQLLSIQAGYDPRAPLSIAQGPQAFARRRQRPALRGLRIGWLGDLGGHLAIEARHAAGLRAGAAGAWPTRGAVEPLRARLRCRSRLAGLAGLAPRARRSARRRRCSRGPARASRSSPRRCGSTTRRSASGVMDFMRASAVRTAFHAHLRRLFERFDALALPVAQVWPFPVGERWPQDGGRPHDGHLPSLDGGRRSTPRSPASRRSACPRGSIPTGAGRQGCSSIGRPQGDAALLRIAAAYEALVPDLLARRPPAPAG